MGYSSDFELSVEGSIVPYNEKEFVAELESISGYDWEDPYFINDNGEIEIQLFRANWYNAENDLVTLSKKYPDLRISCLAKGEDGEQIIYDVFNGKIDQRDGEMIFSERTLW